MLSKLFKDNRLKTLLYIAIICVVVQMLTSVFFKVNENFDIYESPLAPSVYPDSLLLEDTYNVNKSLKTKNMPGDYVNIKRNENTKDFSTPDNGMCTPMDVCGLYVNKKNID
jgi:hypothetical protein|tara:strand:+ start:4339 stop:4674 length:336 start_codon:yes stop_codon:yes gene_type:complete